MTLSKYPQPVLPFNDTERDAYHKEAQKHFVKLADLVAEGQTLENAVEELAKDSNKFSDIETAGLLLMVDKLKEAVVAFGDKGWPQVAKTTTTRLYNYGNTSTKNLLREANLNLYACWMLQKSLWTYRDYAQAKHDAAREILAPFKGNAQSMQEEDDMLKAFYDVCNRIEDLIKRSQKDDNKRQGLTLSEVMTKLNDTKSAEVMPKLREVFDEYMQEHLQKQGTQDKKRCFEFDRGLQEESPQETNLTAVIEAIAKTGPKRLLIDTQTGIIEVFYE